ncbi:MAG: bacillithiol biosynthesis BshC [Thermoanaerobaculia bacterium]|nr:bacillithiol biosynthesis BshC [Thermoanaerobaculia bacterium]
MTIPLETLPAIPLLARGHATGAPDVSRFLGERASVDAIAARAAEVLSRFRPRVGADASLAELASGERAAVVTGQQVGLLTGPLLTAVKALAAVKVAEDLTAAGTPLAPVFWCASEDHDLVEVTRVPLPGPDGPIETGPDPEPLARNRRPVGGLPVEVDVAAILERARAEAGSLADEESLEALRAAHAGATYRSAFVASLSWLLGEPALLFADAARAEEKPFLVPLAVRLVREREVVRRRLETRAAELAAAGHPLQVVSEPGALPLFALVDGERLLLREREGALELKGRDGERFAEEDVVARFEAGEWLPSFSALSRPLAASTLYPVAATVLGPAELAYWAQMLPLFEWAGLVPPILVPRPMAAPVTAAERRALGRLGLGLADLLAGVDALLARRGAVRAGELLDELVALRDGALSGLDALAPRLAAVEAGLGKNVAATRENVRFAFEKLADRARAAAGRADEAEARQLRRLAASLAPGGRPAERLYPPLPWLLRHGRAGLVGPLKEQLRWDVAGLQEIDL